MTKKQFLKKWGIGIILPILLIILLYVIQSILVHFPNVCEGYSKTVFGVLSFLPVKLSSIVPISLTEVFVFSENDESKTSGSVVTSEETESCGVDGEDFLFFGLSAFSPQPERINSICK